MFPEKVSREVAVPVLRVCVPLCQACNDMKDMAERCGDTLHLRPVNCSIFSIVYYSVFFLVG